GRTVRGRILDALGEPIVGATVMGRGTTNGAVTDMDGTFSLSHVAQGQELVVTYVGYQSKVVKADGQEVLNVRLTEDVDLLNEVVAVGYGTQKKANLTGSVSSVTARD
ncbi:SusC/RagA family protein, partial [Bacillus pumilus]